MFNKATNIISLLLVFVFIALLIITLSNTTKTNDESNPISFSVEDSVSTSFVLKNEKPLYVFIKNKNIYINYDDESLMPVKLEDKEWSRVSLSPDKSNLVFLGKETGTVNDMYLYNIESKQFNKITFFENEPSGITSFFWLNDNLIAFHQDQWLHTVNVDSREIIKVQSGVRDLVGITEERIFMNNTSNKAAVYDFAGNDFTDNFFSSEIKSVTQTEEGLFVILSDGTFKIENNSANKLFNRSTGQMCGEKIIDTNGVFEILTNEKVNTPNYSSALCVANEVYYNQDSKWYTLENEEIDSLENSVFFDKF